MLWDESGIRMCQSSLIPLVVSAGFEKLADFRKGAGTEMVYLQSKLAVSYSWITES